MSNRLTQIALDFGPEHAAPPPAPAVVVAETIAQPPLTQYIETAGVVVRLKALKNPRVETMTPPAAAGTANGAPAVSAPLTATVGAPLAPAVNAPLAATVGAPLSVASAPLPADTESLAQKEDLPQLPLFIDAELFPMPPVEEPAAAVESKTVVGPETVAEPEAEVLPETEVESEPVAEPTPVETSEPELVATADPVAETTIPELAAHAPAAEPAPVEEPAVVVGEPAAVAEEPAALTVAPPAVPAEPAAVSEPVPAAAEPTPTAEPDPVPEFRTKSRRANGTASATSANGTPTNGATAKTAKSVKPAVSKRGRKSLKQVSAEADLIEIPGDEVLFSKQYYTMGEVSEMFRVNQSLLRFWETEFDILQPRKNKKGDRYFRPIDIKNLHLIYHLLRQKKFTIEGAKEFLKKNKKAEERFEIVQRLQEIRSFLLEWKAQL